MRIPSDALVRAEAAHLAFEAQHGATPWPEWYAKHLAVESEHSEAELLEALIAASAAHGIYEDAVGEGRDEQWAVWYAEHMATRI